MELTPAQLAAVDLTKLDRDLCVVAGPGSGKTRVLVELFTRLVESGIPAIRILAITFTDKAANEMRVRLGDSFSDRPNIRRQLERAYVSTVHGFCSRLLHENSVTAGVDPQFRTLDEREASQLEQTTMTEALDALLAEQPDAAKELMRALASADLGSALLDVYDAMRAAGMTIADLRRLAPGATAPLE